MWSLWTWDSTDPASTSFAGIRSHTKRSLCTGGMVVMVDGPQCSTHSQPVTLNNNIPAWYNASSVPISIATWWRDENRFQDSNLSKGFQILSSLTDNIQWMRPLLAGWCCNISGQVCREAEAYIPQSPTPTCVGSETVEVELAVCTSRWRPGWMGAFIRCILGAPRAHWDIRMLGSLSEVCSHMWPHSFCTPSVYKSMVMNCRSYPGCKSVGKDYKLFVTVSQTLTRLFLS